MSEYCDDHKSHAHCLQAGHERFEKIDAKLDTLLTWRAELRGGWKLATVLVLLVGTLSGAASGVAAVYAIRSAPHLVAMATHR